MGTNRRPVVFILLIAVALLAISLSACTRSASNPPTGEGTEGLPFPTPGEGGTPDMMGTLLAGGFATQTAQAMGPAGEATPEATATQEETTPRETATPQQATATPEPTQAPAETTPCESPYVVSSGEWVYSIGRKCNLDPWEIVALNNLSYPYLIYPGDELVLPSDGGGNGSADEPSGGTCESPYVVQAGDRVYTIAQECGVSQEDIISANNLAYPYTIYPGDELIIP